MPPGPFGELYRSNEPSDGADFFGLSSNSWLRDAYVAYQFAEKISASAVRLVPRPAERPDFEIEQFGGSVSGFEVTAAFRPGDQPAKRYKRWKKDGYPLLHVSQEELAGCVEALPVAVRLAADRKIAHSLERPYPVGTGLVIYVSVGDYASRDDQVDRDRIVVENAAHARDYFDSVWALYNGRLLRC